MLTSNARFQLVTTFNEWGEGTAVESALEWASPSGFGAYLDVLHEESGGAGQQASSPPSGGRSYVLAGAGDIADSDRDAERTAKLLDAIRTDVVFTTGDNAYDSGSLSEYRAHYEPTWGRFRSKTRPAPGNHEYLTRNAAGYFEYFGAAAGEPGKGYYSYDVGSWHVIVLNSNCSFVGGCGRGSPQERWLRQDLQAHSAVCTLAYWHHPRFSSGHYSDNSDFEPFWQALYEAGAELVVNGHDHNYQRYVPQTPTGARDDARGIREIVVGTGGKSAYSVGPAPVRNREVASDGTFGVLQLTLRPAGYDWKFVPVAGSTFTDSGSGSCH
jgi:hypothetical protein